MRYTNPRLLYFTLLFYYYYILFCCVLPAWNKVRDDDDDDLYKGTKVGLHPVADRRKGWLEFNGTFSTKGYIVPCIN